MILSVLFLFFFSFLVVDARQPQIWEKVLYNVCLYLQHIRQSGIVAQNHLGKGISAPLCLMPIRFIRRFTQNLSVFRRDINESLKAPISSASSSTGSGPAAGSEMMTS